MRLFGLRNDCAEDVHRADANRLDHKKKKIVLRATKMREGEDQL